MANVKRSYLLKSLTITMLIMGVGIFVVTLISSLEPVTSKIDDKQTSIKLSSIETGEITPLDIIMGPMVVFKPSEEQIDDLISANSLVVGPKYNSSSMPKIFIYRPLGSMGCKLSKFDKGDERMSVLKIKWPGGWIDPCRPGAWDFAGRVLKNVNAPPDYVDKLHNLFSPEYEIEHGIIRFYPLSVK